MSLIFKFKDVVHKIIVKFVPAYLPGAKKKYNAKSVLQTELTIREIAAKAAVYNITTSPAVIEEGFTAAIELITYLVADNYKIKTDLFHLSIRIPGEYDGTETHLPAGVYPEVKMIPDDTLRNYIREHVKVVFDGVEESNGFMGEVIDEATGEVDHILTAGNIITINGYGLKVEGDNDHRSQVGVFLVDEHGSEFPFKAIATNEPRTLKLLVDENTPQGMAFYIVVRTQSTVKHGGGHTLKEIREVKSANMFIVQS